MKNDWTFRLKYGTPRARWGVGIVLFLAILTGSAHGQEDEKIRGRFLSEGPPAWEVYGARAEKLHGSYESLSKEDGKVRGHHRGEYKNNARCQYVLSHDVGAEKDTVYLYNSDYSSILIRKKASESWVMSSLVLRKEGTDTKFDRRFLDSLGVLTCLNRAYAVDLTDLVKHPNFQIVRISSLLREGSDLVQIEFTSFHPLNQPSEKSFPVQSGSIVLDPDRYWCLRSCELLCKYNEGDAKVEVQNELAVSPGNFPIPKSHRFTRVLITQAEKWTDVAQFDFDLIEPSILPPDAEFYQSRFGLPEPLGITPPRSPVRWFFWLALATFFFLGVAALLVTLRRRYIRGTKTIEPKTDSNEGRP